jgi:hypothetical protein
MTTKLTQGHLLEEGWDCRIDDNTMLSQLRCALENEGEMN